MDSSWEKLIGPFILRAISKTEETKALLESLDPTAAHLSKVLRHFVKKVEVRTKSELSRFVDELMGMSQAVHALSLIDMHEGIWHHLTFAELQSEAIAAMLSGEYGRGTECLLRGFNLAPTEPSTYVNMAQIYSQTGKLKEAWQWAEKGLEVAPNHAPIWQVMADLTIKQDKEDLSKIKSLADKFSSWQGQSLLCAFSGGDPARLWATLKPFYENGESSEEFLQEYTGILGEIGDYDQVLAVLKRARMLNGDRWSWQLELHLLQTYLAVEDEQGAKKQAALVLERQDLPVRYKGEVEALLAAEST